MTATSDIEAAIGYQFRDKKLLLRAITHGSYANQHNVEDHHQLEFVGDRVLDLCLADFIVKLQPDCNSRIYTQLLFMLRSNAFLAEIAEMLGIATKFGIIGRGAMDKKHRQKPVADCMEAILGAIFLESGIGVASEIVWKWFEPELNEIRGRVFTGKISVQMEVAT